MPNVVGQSGTAMPTRLVVTWAPVIRSGQVRTAPPAPRPGGRPAAVGGSVLSVGC